MSKNFNLKYGYTTFLAFLMNLRFNNSRKMKLSVIEEYPKVLVEELNKRFKDSEYHFTFINDLESLDKFLDDCYDIFEVRGDTIYLRDDTTSIDELDRILALLNEPYSDICKDLITYNDRLKECMELKLKKSVYKSKLFFEGLMYSYYIKFAMGSGKKDFKTLIRNYLEYRNNFYKNLVLSDRTSLIDFDSENNIFENEELYPNYPLDKKINYYKIFKDADNTVNNILMDPYMLTIFDENSKPAKYRIYKDCTTLLGKYHEEEEFKNEIEYKQRVFPMIAYEKLMCNKLNFTPRVWEEKLFYLDFINNLDKLQEKYGKNEDLELTKYKLIYLLDDVNCNLMDDNNREKEYNRVYDRYFNNDESKTRTEDIINYSLDFYWYQVLALAFVIDLFENDLYDEGLIYKKLAFIKTYYSLTNDEEIIKLFNDRKDDPRYFEYASFIKGNNKKLVK